MADMSKAEAEQLATPTEELRRTHLNAYFIELQEAEEALKTAVGNVGTAKRNINDRLVADGGDPIFDENGELIKGVKIPAEARGFGYEHKDGAKK